LRSNPLLSNCRKMLGLLVLSGVALCGGSATAQNHDAFDKPLGYDNGREEQAAHRYLNQTGREDANGDSQVEPNQSNLQSPSNDGGQRNAARDQSRRQQNRDQGRRADRDDDNALHHAVLGVSLGESDGHVHVIAVMPGSPAAKAGLRVGDVIRYVGDQRIATAQGLAEEISEYRPGSQVDLAIRRDGEKQTVTAKLGSSQFGSAERDRFNQNGDATQQRNRQSNGDLQASRGRAAYSYRSANPQNDGSQAQVSQKLRDLQRQISQLQHELNDLQSSLGEPR